MNRELDFQLRSLEGNINRMCVTDSISELDTMRDFAQSWIKIIHDIILAMILAIILARLEGEDVQ